MRRIPRIACSIVLASLGFAVAGCNDNQPVDDAGTAKTSQQPATASPQVTEDSETKTPDVDVTAPNTLDGMPNPCSLVGLRQVRMVVDKSIELTDKSLHEVQGQRNCYYVKGQKIGFVAVTVMDAGAEEGVRATCTDNETTDVNARPNPAECVRISYAPETYGLNGVTKDTGVTESWWVLSEGADDSNPQTEEKLARLFMFTDSGINVTLAVEGTDEPDSLIQLGRDIASALGDQLK